LTADIRIAAHGIKLGMPPAKLGLIYSHTGLRKFLDVIGPAHTNELFFTGRNIDADRAAAIWLVNHVVEPDELEQASLDLAAEIAANAPISLKGNKRIIRALREVPQKLPDDLERDLIKLRESCFYTEDFREGVRAFAEKRAPEWRDR
jgi:enoyl-CoA hydratase/carnithine racemase